MDIILRYGDFNYHRVISVNSERIDRRARKELVTAVRPQRRPSGGLKTASVGH